MRSLITVLWLELTESECALLAEQAELAGASMLRVDRDALAAETFAALALGGVVVIARTGREASSALGMGADEVLRTGEISGESVADAMRRAQARAAARLSREVHRATQNDVEPVLSELVGALEHQLSDRLGQAAGDLELLATWLPALLQIGDDLVATASAPPSPERLQELAARWLALPRTPALRAVLAHIQESMRGAEKTSQAMRGLVSEDPQPIGRLVAQTVEILRPRLPAGMEVRVAVEGACGARAPTLLVALTVTSLVARAAEALRDAGHAPAIIEVRVAEHDDAVVVEVEDGAGEAERGAEISLAETYFATVPTRRTRLARLRERIRRCGGDLLVDGGGSSTAIRVFFPTKGSEVVLDGERAPALSLSAAAGAGAKIH